MSESGTNKAEGNFCSFRSLSPPSVVCCGAVFLTWQKPEIYFPVSLIFPFVESRHSTSKLPWSECMDFSDTQIFIVSDLQSFKKFLNQGFYLTIVEEKVT